MVYREPPSGHDPPDNQRAFVRVATHLVCRARRLESVDEAPMYRAQPTLASSGRRSSSEISVPESLASINSKLDQLLAESGMIRLVRDFPLELQVTELSGSGMRTRQPEPALHAGEALEVLLVLCQAPLSLASAVAQVTRVQDQELAFTFSSIKENHRQAIIQFVLEEQREERRSRW